MVVADPGRQDKVDKEMAKTYKELAKGNADRDAGKFDKAINRYTKAWEHACHAIKHATKARLRGVAARCIHDLPPIIVMRAKRATTNEDIRRTWILFGDPTLKLR